MPDMQGRGRAVVSDIGCHIALFGKGVETGGIRHLVDEATALQDIEEIGLVGAHIGTLQAI